MHSISRKIIYLKRRHDCVCYTYIKQVLIDITELCFLALINIHKTEYLIADIFFFVLERVWRASHSLTMQTIINTN